MSTISGANRATPTPATSGRVVYSDAAESTFRAALATLAKTLPNLHGDLKRLVDEGKFHDVAAIEAVLDGGVQ